MIYIYFARFTPSQNHVSSRSRSCCVRFRTRLNCADLVAERSLRRLCFACCSFIFSAWPWHKNPADDQPTGEVCRFIAGEPAEPRSVYKKKQQQISGPPAVKIRRNYRPSWAERFHYMRSPLKLRLVGWAESCAGQIWQWCLGVWVVAGWSWWLKHLNPINIDDGWVAGEGQGSAIFRRVSIFS